MSLLSKSQSSDTDTQHPGPLHLMDPELPFQSYSCLLPTEALCLFICVGNYFRQIPGQGSETDLSPQESLGVIPIHVPC